MRSCFIPCCSAHLQYVNPGKKCPDDVGKTTTPWCVKCPTAWCKDGEYRTGSCTAAGNTFACQACVIPGTVSASCSSGQYRTGTCGKDTNEFKCADQPICSSGQYLKEAGDTAQGVCADQPTCATSEYLKDAGEENAGVCTPQPTCAAGRQYLAGASATQQGRCVDCNNRSCQTREYRAGMCSGGTNAYECKSQDPCPAGTVYAATPTAPRACQSCPDGTFRGETGHYETVCSPHARPCSTEEYEEEAPTKTSNRVCSTQTTCRSGDYASGKTPAGKLLCMGVKTCVKGQFVVEDATPASDRVCNDCPDLTYSDSDNAEECNAVSFCRESQRVVAPSTSTSDLRCGKCARGTVMSEKKHRRDWCDETTSTSTSTSTSSVTSSTTSASSTTTTTTATSPTTTTSPLAATTALSVSLHAGFFLFFFFFSLLLFSSPARALSLSLSLSFCAVLRCNCSMTVATWLRPLAREPDIYIERTVTGRGLISLLLLFWLYLMLMTCSLARPHQGGRDNGEPRQRRQQGRQ